GPSCRPVARRPSRRPAWPFCRSRTRSRYPRSPRRRASFHHYSYSLPSCPARRSAVRFLFLYSEPDELSGPGAEPRPDRAPLAKPANGGAPAPRAPSDRGRLAVEGAVQTLAQQLQRRQLAGRGRLEAPAHDALGADHDQSTLGEAAGVQNAEGCTRRALRLEVRQLLAAHAELFPERLLRPAGIAGDPVQRHAALGELAKRSVVQLQLVGADGAER